MNQTVSPARVRELVLMAKELRTDEIQILLAAVGLQAAQDIACAMIEDAPYEYEGETMYHGVDLWDHAPVIIEDIVREQELAEIVNGYNLGPMFNIQLQRELVATPVKV